MPEAVGSLPGGEVTSERANSAAQAKNCSFRRRAQTGFQLAERHLDGVQVRRVLGQIAKRGAARCNRLTNASRFVRRKIVDQQLRAGALVIAADALFNDERDQIVRSAQSYSVPTIYEFREFVAAGGLMSYGSNNQDAYRQAGILVSWILKGETGTTIDGTNIRKVLMCGAPFWSTYGGLTPSLINVQPQRGGDAAGTDGGWRARDEGRQRGRAYVTTALHRSIVANDWLSPQQRPMSIDAPTP
jgi:hypothetical protein